MRLWIKAGEMVLGQRLPGIPTTVLYTPGALDAARAWAETSLMCRFTRPPPGGVKFMCIYDAPKGVADRD